MFPLELLESKADIYLGLALILLNFTSKGIKLGLNISYLGTPLIGKTTDVWGICARQKLDYFKDRLSQDFHNPKQFRNQLNKLFNKPIKSSSKNIKLNNDSFSDASLIPQDFNQHFSSICGSQRFDFHSITCSLNLTTHTGSFSFKKIMPVVLVLMAWKLNLLYLLLMY